MMRIITVFLLIFGSLFTILNCNKDINETGLRPEAVLWKSKSAETAWLESGIDAISEGNGIYLEWRIPQSGNIDSFRLFRAKENTEEVFEPIREIAGSDSNLIDLDVQTGERYYYFIQAIDHEGRKTVSSDTISYKLLEKAGNLKIIRDDSSLHFFWTDPNPFDAPFYVLRLFNSSDESLIWLAQVQTQYGETEQTIKFNEDGAARLDPLESGQTYHWRIDIIGVESNSGSESNWASFSIN